MFTELLNQDLIDCFRLDDLAHRRSLCSGSACSKELDIFTTTFQMDPTCKLSRMFKSPLLDSTAHRSKDTLSEPQRKFLLRHSLTIGSILSADHLEKILNYFQSTCILSNEQCILVRAEPSANRVQKLLEHLTNPDATKDAYNRLCHALLLIGQYRLFSILHEMADVQRLESFAKEKDRLLLALEENRENLAERVDDAPLIKLDDEELVVDQVPEPSGVLENLSVDVPDTNVASQLSYYSSNKQDVSYVFIICSIGVLFRSTGTSRGRKVLLSSSTTIASSALPSVL